MRIHPELFQRLTDVTITPPLESQQQQQKFFRSLDLLKHTLNITPKWVFVRSGPCNKSEFNEVPWNEATQSNSTDFLFPFMVDSMMGNVPSSTILSIELLFWYLLCMTLLSDVTNKVSVI